MPPRLRIPLLALALLAWLLVALGAASAQPRGPEPDLPPGNGELAAVVGIRPSDGRQVICTAWVTKVTGVKLALFWGCWDGGVRPYVSGRVEPAEVRGAVHGVVVVYNGELTAVYSTPNDETSQVTAQEIHFQPLGVPLFSMPLPVREQRLLPVLTP